MIEILVSGNCNNDFNRLNVSPKLTYGDENSEFKVYEVTEEDFKILCNEADTENTWENCGWRHCTGINKGNVNDILKINGKDLKCWYEVLEDEECYEEDEDDYKPEYEDLLTYLYEELNCSTFKNICALLVDLAKANKISMSELFKIYQK